VVDLSDLERLQGSRGGGYLDAVLKYILMQSDIGLGSAPFLNYSLFVETQE
jgi:hypothetical protein